MWDAGTGTGGGDGRRGRDVGTGTGCGAVTEYTLLINMEGIYGFSADSMR